MPHVETERGTRARTVLVSGGPDQSWALVPIRLRDRLRAHLESSTLDARLAHGESTTGDRALAVRAGMLVAPGKRRQLADGWSGVLPAAVASAGRTSSVPPRPDQVQAARTEIEDLVVALQAPGPVAPRGVAAANLLLTDGTGPLYNPGHPGSLRAGVRAALEHLGPSPALNL